MLKAIILTYNQMQIYFIRCQDFVKIGKAIYPKYRLRSLQIGCPFNLELIRTIDSNISSVAERWLHLRFNLSKIRNEWFLFDEEMLTIKLPSLEEIKKDLQKVRTNKKSFKNKEEILREIQNLADACFRKAA